MRPVAGTRWRGHPARGGGLFRFGWRLGQPPAVREDPRLGGRAHRLAGNPARPDRAHRRAEVPAELAGRLNQRS
ncbi:hypothetical protein, partial [Acinetobacter baumannii]|uniref:hypothetical protein n=1 Tax=Acinetobacter baumannii TaxID=470 RepID=UPI00338E605D